MENISPMRDHTELKKLELEYRERGKNRDRKDGDGA